MENSIFRLVKTIIFSFIILETSCEPLAKHLRFNNDDRDWWNIKQTPFPHSWSHEDRGQKMWYNDRPEPPNSPFHPEEIPIGLRSPFPGFRDSIYERVVRPYLRNNVVSRQNSPINYAEKNVLFRHEVEKLQYQPQPYRTEKSRPGRANRQEEKIAPSNAILHYGEKPQFRGIGDLPLSDPRKPNLYRDFVFNP